MHVHKESSYTYDILSYMDQQQDKVQYLNSWVLKNIKKKECIQFIKSPKSSDKWEVCFCGYVREDHSEQSQIPSDEKDWNPEKHVQEMPTDAYGYFTFKGASKDIKKYVRTSNSTPSNILYEMITKEWNLSLPNLLVSVFGGTDEFTASPRMNNIFMMGILHKAQMTGTWIITEGINTGVMKHIGEAVKDFGDECSRAGEELQIVNIGIAAWGTVQNRHSLISKATTTPVEYTLDEEIQGTLFCLDNNHSNFILVDDGTHGNRGVESQLRMDLEEFISEQSLETEGGTIKIPLLRVFFGGGHSGLDIMFDAMKNSIPCVLVEGSGGITDLIIQVANLKAPEITITLINHKLRTSLRNSFISFTGMQIIELTKKIQDIVRMSHLLTIFTQEPKIGEQTNVEKLVVDAFMKVNQSSDYHGDGNVGYQLKLAKLWNRLDIAKNGISRALEPEELHEVMTKALLENNWKFVKLVMDHLELNTFLTWKILILLYKSINPPKPIYFMLHKLVHEDMMSTKAYERTGIQMHHIAKVLRGLLGESTEPLYPHLKRKHSELKMEISESAFEVEVLSAAEVYTQYPVRDLLIWAVVQNFGNLSDVFWAKTDDCIAGALACRKILIELSHAVEDSETLAEIKTTADHFEKLAIGMFSVCCSKNEKKAEQLLTRVSVAWGSITCLQLAVSAKAVNFMSHGGVQMFLTKVWWGALATFNRPVSVVLCGTFLPLIYTGLIIFRTHKYSEELGVKPPRMTCWERLSRFCSAPVVIFYWNFISHVCFLLLFTYVLTMDFQNTPSLMEYILYGWMFTLMCENSRQSIYDMEGRGLACARKTILDMGEFHKKMDVLSLLLLVSGIILRNIETTLYTGKIFLALDFAIHSIRLMHMFEASRYLGPKIIMMQRMVTDILFFLFILGVSVISYGVSKQAILVNNEHRWDWLMRNILYEPYRTLFGQLSDNIDGMTIRMNLCSLDGSNPRMTKCPYNDGAGNPVFPNWLTIILHCIYLLFANILLINLLIAMFSYTFAEVQAHADEIWKFQRYQLIAEYHNRPIAPPPLIIFSHLVSCIRCTFRCHPLKHKINLVQKLNTDKDSYLLSWEASMRKLYLQKHQKDRPKKTDERTEAASKNVSSELQQIITGQVIILKTIEQRLDTLEEKVGRASMTTAPVVSGSFTDVPVQEVLEIEETVEGLRFLYHVNARDHFYPGSTVKRFPVPDEKVPWQVSFHRYEPPTYTVFEGRRESIMGSFKALTFSPPKNPMGRTGIQGFGSLDKYGPNHCFFLLLTCWKKNKSGIFIRRDSKKMMEILVAKYQSSKDWTLPGGMLSLNESLPSSLSYIVYSDYWEELQALIQTQGKEVYKGYIDDSRNTDNAWVEATAVHLHLQSQIISDMLVLDADDDTIYSWMVMNKNMPLDVLKKDIFKKIAESYVAYF